LWGVSGEIGHRGRGGGQQLYPGPRREGIASAVRHRRFCFWVLSQVLDSMARGGKVLVLEKNYRNRGVHVLKDQVLFHEVQAFLRNSEKSAGRPGKAAAREAGDLQGVGGVFSKWKERKRVVDEVGWGQVGILVPNRKSCSEA